MTCCKKIPIVKLNISEVEKIKNTYQKGKKLFISRYNLNNWKSITLIDNFNYTKYLHQFPIIKNWYDCLNLEIEHAYLSILEPKTSIPWHTDMSTDVFNPTFLTSISTNSSFIEFKNDKKYVYKLGYSYIIRSAIEHRILNLSDDIRITLCSTPRENPYV